MKRYIFGFFSGFSLVGIGLWLFWKWMDRAVDKAVRSVSVG